MRVRRRQISYMNQWIAEARRAAWRGRRAAREWCIRAAPIVGAGGRRAAAAVRRQARREREGWHRTQQRVRRPIDRIGAAVRWSLGSLRGRWTAARRIAVRMVPHGPSRRRWTRRLAKTAAVTAGLSVLILSGEAIGRAYLSDTTFVAPTRFYARPIVLTPGERINRERAENSLQRLGYRETAPDRVGIGEYHLGFNEWIIGRRAFRIFDRIDPGGLVTVRFRSGDRVRSVYDDTGRRLPYLPLEPEPLGQRAGDAGEDRIPLPLSEIPRHLLDAVLSIEDQRFFEHAGLDLRRVAGAAVANVRARRIVQGGSTLTQQLAKNLFLSARRSPIRKARELAMALVLEARYPKARIFEAYLNEVYLGQDRGLAIHGVGRAAQFYFGKDVSQLDLSESALLAGIIRGPSLYAPFRRPDVARERRNLVLDVMHGRGIIPDSTHRRARDMSLGLREPTTRHRSGRYFVDHVASSLRDEGVTRAGPAGFSVITTLDMDLQRLAENAVDRGLAALEANDPTLKAADPPLQAALVAIDPATGEILTMVGGRNYGTSQFNRAVFARRQPGSAFKPIVAMAALTDRTPGYTLASRLEDAPLTLETPAGLWRPANYDRQYHGRVTLREALERSLNVPFARLGIEMGPDRIVDAARNLGIESRLRAVPSLALGSSEVTPLELTRAFGTLAAGGFLADAQTTVGVLDDEGTILYRLQPGGRRAYQPAETYLVTSALEGVIDRGTGRGVRAFGYRGPLAGKTGTTNGYRDAWFVGYTPNLAVGVWVGFDDGRSIGRSGAAAALPIFARFIVEAAGPNGNGGFRRPAGVEVVEIDTDTGLAAGYGCRGEREVFLRGTAPYGSCSSYRYSSGRYRRSPSNRSRSGGRRGGGR